MRPKNGVCVFVIFVFLVFIFFVAHGWLLFSLFAFVVACAFLALFQWQIFFWGGGRGCLWYVYVFVEFGVSDTRCWGGQWAGWCTVVHGEIR